MEFAIYNDEIHFCHINPCSLSKHCGMAVFDSALVKIAVFFIYAYILFVIFPCNRENDCKYFLSGMGREKKKHKKAYLQTETAQSPRSRSEMCSSGRSMRNPCSQHVTSSIASTMPRLESGVQEYRLWVFIHKEKKAIRKQHTTEFHLLPVYYWEIF